MSHRTKAELKRYETRHRQGNGAAAVMVKWVMVAVTASILAAAALAIAATTAVVIGCVYAIRAITSAHYAHQLPPAAGNTSEPLEAPQAEPVLVFAALPPGDQR